mgnify:CR=1 FL=1
MTTYQLTCQILEAAMLSAADRLETFRDHTQQPEAREAARRFLIELTRLQTYDITRVQTSLPVTRFAWVQSWYDSRDEGATFRAQWPRLQTEVAEKHRETFARTTELERLWNLTRENTDERQRDAIACAILEHQRQNLLRVAQTVCESSEVVEVAFAVMDKLWPVPTNAPANDEEGGSPCPKN